VGSVTESRDPGVPKGIQYTDGSLLAAARGVSLHGRAGEQAGEMGSILFPVCHIGGIVYSAAMLQSGPGSVLVDMQRALPRREVLLPRLRPLPEDGIG
jgi:hypothetical protein